MLEGDRLWLQFDSRVAMDEWQSRWVGVGGIGLVDWQSASKRFSDGSWTNGQWDEF